MNVFPYTTVPAETYAGPEGVSIRWAIGENVGAPNFVLRVIELEVGAATAYHQHAWEHEVFVLAGAGLARDAKDATPIQTGSCVYVAPNELHQFVNRGDAPLRFICVIPKPPK
jgi:quercetin dioxygenase-like cupin family protein